MSWLATAIVCVGLAGNPVPQCKPFHSKSTYATEQACKEFVTKWAADYRKALAAHGVVMLRAQLSCRPTVKGIRT